jgi:membrane-bound acyltransferase YfiQ involved in biofilm formation
MQTMGNYLGLGPSEETLESMFQVATRTFNLLYYFPFMLLIGLTSLASIYSQTPVLSQFSFEINLVHSKLLSSVFPLDSGPF